jgi:hypothetical protein
MLTKMRLFASCFAYVTAVNVERVKTVLVVGETHVLWIQFGDKLTQMIKKCQIVWPKYKIGLNTYFRDAK